MSAGAEKCQLIFAGADCINFVTAPSHHDFKTRWRKLDLDGQPHTKQRGDTVGDTVIDLIFHLYSYGY
jgi:hypothetical protein